MKGLIVSMICVALALILGLSLVLGLGVSGLLKWPENWSVNWSAANIPLVNRQTFSASRLREISAGYTADSLLLDISPTDEVILEEYISGNWDSDMLASCRLGGESLDIKGGRRPAIMGWFSFRSKVILYLPASFTGKVTLNSQSGSIRCDQNLKLGSLYAAAASGSVRFQSISAAGNVRLTSKSGGVSTGDITAKDGVTLESGSGSVRINRVTAADISAQSRSGSVSAEEITGEKITAQSGSGSVRIGKIYGAFKLESSSGSVSVGGGEGSGSAGASSGSVKVRLEGGLNGDLQLSSGNGSCTLTLPDSCEFNLTAQTGSGGLYLPDNGGLSYRKGEKEASGSFGNMPRYAVSITSGSGSVRLHLE